jgi:hypothetical protein
MSKRIVELGKLELKDGEWSFFSYDTTKEYNLRGCSSLFWAMAELARDGWEPTVNYENNFFFKRIW